MTTPANDHFDHGPAERYQSFMRGWRDGAYGKARAPSFDRHATRPDLREAYAIGYREGRSANGLASQTAAQAFGWSPSILREAGAK